MTAVLKCMRSEIFTVQMWIVVFGDTMPCRLAGCYQRFGRNVRTLGPKPQNECGILNVSGGKEKEIYVLFRIKVFSSSPLLSLRNLHTYFLYYLSGITKREYNLRTLHTVE
jgi:hypothetical protein